MSIIIPANSAVSGGFDVANSCMFNRADSANMTRSASGSSATKSTFSFWVKRTLISAGGDFTQIIHNFYSAGTTYNKLYFDGNDQIIMKQQVSGSTQIQIMPSMKFRDASAWYHIVYIVDPTESTEANRVKVYVNGTQITSFGTSTYPAEDAAVRVEYNQFIGREYSGDTKFLDGYLAEFVFLDGVAASIGDLGEFDEDSGIWKPIDVSGLTFGSRGFYLDFEDSSALGNDAVGSNNFTVNNIAATDQGTDTCTNNFATLNILAPPSSGLDIRQGNTLVFNDDDNNAWQTIPATMVITPTGKFYWEIFCSGVWGTSACEAHGITDLDTTLQTLTGQASANTTTFAWQNNASFRSNGGTVGSTTWAVTYATNDILMFALDNANGALYAGKNGTWLNSGNPESGSSKTGALAVTVGLNYAPHSEVKYGSDNPFYNFGSPYYAISSGNADGDGFGNFEYAVPSGYFALCTKNLAEYG